MATTLKDITGQRFGRLVVLHRGPNGDRSRVSRWICRCDCGVETQPIYSSRLRNGGTQSCGCLQRERSGAAAFRHGNGSRRAGESYLYTTWSSIKTRLFNPNCPTWKHYGGRGLEIYEAWRHDFAAFRDWILVNLGERPDGYSLDRIDVNGNYEPGNLRWANRVQQAGNKRATVARVEQLQRQFDDLATYILTEYQ